jgi:hypothetical protein
VLAFLEALNVLLCTVLLFLEVLIAFDGGTKMKGKLLINDFVHCFSERGPAVKDSELVRREWRTDVVHRDGLQDAVVDGVVLAVSGLDFRFAVLYGIRDVGGDDKTVGGGIGNEDPVIRGGEGVIQFPTHTWVFSADPLRGGMRRISLWRGISRTVVLFVILVIPAVLRFVLP